MRVLMNLKVSYIRRKNKMDEKEFLNHIDNGVLFEDDELQEMPWLFKVVDGPEEADKEKAATVYLIY